MKTEQRIQAGFTLIETVVSIVVMAIGLLGIVYMVTVGLEESANTYDETRTAALAQAYLDEILSRRFDEESHPSGTPACSGLSIDLPVPPRPCTLATAFGSEGGENSRSRYDDVDDYHGIDEGAGGATGSSLLDAEGNARSGYDNFRVQVAVTYVGNQAPVNGVLTDAKLVNVTVIPPGQSAGVVFSVYRANF